MDNMAHVSVRFVSNPPSIYEFATRCLADTVLKNKTPPSWDEVQSLGAATRCETGSAGTLVG